MALCHKLKLEYRHCWFDDGRRESVAEHTFRLAIMVYKYAEKLE